MLDYIICHYGEIGLKGKNRPFFERKLVENIKRGLGLAYFEDVKRVPGRVKRLPGRIVVECLPSEPQTQGVNLRPEFVARLKNVFGISYFAWAQQCPQDIKIIKQRAIQILEQEQFLSFKVKTKRSNKNFALTSPEINQQVGQAILKRRRRKVKDVRVDLENPDLTLYIEIVQDTAFLYTQKIQGPGGLPVGVSGKAVGLISGGIDSPVASFYGMRRGLRIIFVHFTSYPFTEKSAVEKVRKIIKVLNKFQFQSKLHLVPITDFQKQVATRCQEKLRIILYRRFMLRIAQAIAKKEKAKALLTGESLGQVASQTLENIGAIGQASALPILRPLIGMDKLSIIKKAKEIGTYETSILLGDDTCQRFMPQHPETKARLDQVLIEEQKIDINKFLEEALEQTKVETIKAKVE